MPEIPNTTLVDYYFAATDNTDEHYRGTFPENAPDEYFSFDILPTAENVQVLLMHSGSQDYNSVEFEKFTSIFDDQNVIYDIYDWEEYESYRVTDNYDIIFMYGKAFGHGNEEDTLSLAIMEFLDKGTNDHPRNIFTASDDLADKAYMLYSYSMWDRPLTKFYYAYIRGGYIPTGYGGGTDGIGGPDIFDYSEGSILITEESVIGNANQEMSTFSNSPDVIEQRACLDVYENEVSNPEISSITAFIFEDGPIGGQAYAYHNSSAISLDNLIYKSFFTSFDLSQFTDTDINTIIEDALIWFGYIPTAIESNLILKEPLIKVFPNPNNGLFSIEISNMEISNSNLQIFNSQGKVIYNNELSDVKENIDISGFAKGIYLIKIDNKDISVFKKMIVQ